MSISPQQSVASLDASIQQNPPSQSDLLPEQQEEEPMLTESSRRRAYVVLWSCAALQLPVWGFQLAFGSLQQYESHAGDIKGGGKNAIGIGIIYIVMPFISAFMNRYKHLMRTGAFVGVIITTISLVASAFASQVWQLICALGVLHAVGAALLYIASMNVLNDYFIERKGLAFATTLATKASMGAGTPFLTSGLLENIGYRNTLLVWAGIVLFFGVAGCIPLKPLASAQPQVSAPRRMPWSLLKSRTAWIFIMATTIFSAGYGLPQTYLPSYASQVLKASTPLSATMIALIAAASAPGSILFGMLCDGTVRLRGRRLSVHGASTLSAFTSSLPVFFLWGFGENSALLILFSISYGFFAGGFSAVWSGVMKEVQRERSSEDQSEAALIFGLLNGGRGVGFVIGGVIGAQLLEHGSALAPVRGHAYGFSSRYSSMILYTGLTAVLGGSNLLCKALWHLW